MLKKREEPFISVVVTAAGNGTRMKAEINKQFIELGNMPILAHSIKAFEDYKNVNEIIIVINEKEILLCRKIVINYGFKKVKTIVKGGSTRQKSVFNGLIQVDDNCGIVLIHDGARPFINKEIIKSNISAALEYGAACTAVPVKDTIKTSYSGDSIANTLKRQELWAAQTPQTFEYHLIMEAHQKALAEGFEGSDDATLVERLGMDVRLVRGCYNNIKITTPEDLLIGSVIVNNLISE